MEPWQVAGERSELSRPRHVWVKRTSVGDFGGKDRPGLLLTRRRSPEGRWLALVVYPSHWTSLMGSDGSHHVEWLDMDCLRL